MYGCILGNPGTQITSGNQAEMKQREFGSASHSNGNKIEKDEKWVC